MDVIREEIESSCWESNPGHRLSYQCSATELQQPDNHQPSEFFICRVYWISQLYWLFIFYFCLITSKSIFNCEARMLAFRLRNHSAWVLSWVRKFYDWHLPNGDLTAYAEQLPGVVTRLELPVLCHWTTTTQTTTSAYMYHFFLCTGQTNLWAAFSSAQLHTINFFPPVNCRMPPVPENGMIENISTAEVVFRCNPGFIPVGRMSATCVSPDGISAAGTWTPNPADLVCNSEIQ